MSYNFGIHFCLANEKVGVLGGDVVHGFEIGLLEAICCLPLGIEATQPTLGSDLGTHKLLILILSHSMVTTIAFRRNTFPPNRSVWAYKLDASTLSP